MKIVDNIPHITIPQADGSPYLTRYFLFLKDRKYANTYIHHFHSSDMDRNENGLLFHNHPWLGLSFVLKGSYREERCTRNGEITTKIVKPFSFNYLPLNTFHRVELLTPDVWTIFFTGGRTETRDWFFMDRKTRELIDWRTKIGAVA